jgi:hypothetical protein
MSSVKFTSVNVLLPFAKGPVITNEPSEALVGSSTELAIPTKARFVLRKKDVSVVGAMVRSVPVEYTTVSAFAIVPQGADQQQDGKKSNSFHGILLSIGQNSVDVG